MTSVARYRGTRAGLLAPGSIFGPGLLQRQGQALGPGLILIRGPPDWCEASSLSDGPKVERQSTDEGDFGFHEDHQTSFIIGEVELSLSALPEQPTGFDDGPDNDGREGAGGHLHRVLAKYLQDDRISSFPVIAVEYVLFTDLERQGPGKVKKGDLV